jgi:hypothetical protein
LPAAFEDFVWRWRSSHELDQRAALSKRLPTSMRAAFQRAISKELHLLSDGEPESDIQRAALDVLVKFEDFNADGTPEIFARAPGNGYCGATGNCSFWVFQKSRGEYTVFLNTIAQTFRFSPTERTATEI